MKKSVLPTWTRYSSPTKVKSCPNSKMKSFRCETIWRRKSFSLYGSSRSRNSNTYLGFRSRYISRYENLKFRFLPFVVASIVAMAFSSAVFAARTPAMGNSADRDWQLSQLVEGVLTAFNPSHSSLSCVETNCGVVRVAGYSVVWDCDPPYFPKEHQKERCGHFRSQRSFITFYGALRNILLPAGLPTIA